MSAAFRFVRWSSLALCLILATSAFAQPAEPEQAAPAGQQPRSARQFFLRGVQKGNAGDTDGAIADFSQTISMNPNNAQAFHERGNAERLQKKLDAAIADYGRAIAINSQYGAAYFYRGVAEQAKGDLDAAIADYDRVLAIEPKNVGAYGNRGSAKQAKGDVSGAAADFKKVLELKPDDANAAAMLAKLGKSASGDGWSTVTKSFGDVVLAIALPAGYSEKAPTARDLPDSRSNETLGTFRGLVQYEAISVAALVSTKARSITAEEFKRARPGMEKSFSPNADAAVKDRIKAGESEVADKANAKLPEGKAVSDVRQLFLGTFDSGDDYFSVLTLTHLDATAPGQKTTVNVAGSMTVWFLKGKIFYLFVNKPFVNMGTNDEVKAMTKELVGRMHAGNR